MVNFRKYILPYCLILPMVLLWILPQSIENRLSFNLGFLQVSLLDIFYVIYLIGYYCSQSKHRSITNTRKVLLLVVGSIIVLYCALVLIDKRVWYIPDLIVNNLSYIWLSLIYLFAPLSDKQIQLTKPIMIFALIFLVAEVLLYSLGILQYTSATGDTLRGQEYSGVMRISTTIGGATGSAVIIGLLGAIIVTTYTMANRYKLLILVLTTLGVYFTMSRGTSLCWTVFLIYYFYKVYFNRSNLKKKTKAIFVSLLAICVLYNVGAFTPILDRYEQMDESKDFTAHRDSKFQTSMKMIEKTMPFGYGLGQVFPEKSINEIHRPPHPFAPHNVFTLVAIETGVIGLSLFLIFFLIIFTNISYSRPLSGYLLILIAVNANTESVLLYSEFMSLIMFAIMTVTKYGSSYIKK